jgi:hypothetical protein
MLAPMAERPLVGDGLVKLPDDIDGKGGLPAGIEAILFKLHRYQLARDVLASEEHETTAVPLAEEPKDLEVGAGRFAQCLHQLVFVNHCVSPLWK